MRLRIALTIFLLPGLLMARGIYISRIIPGWYQGEAEHRIDLFNPTAQPIDLSGWLLSTQEYCFQFPQGTVVPAQAVFSIGNVRPGRQAPDLDLENTRGLVVRSARPIPGGNYFLLLNKNSSFVDGMYFCPFPEVPFLPENGRCLMPGGKLRSFSLPNQYDPLWKGRSLAMGEDPALHFIQIGGNWAPTASNANLLPAVSFENVSAEFQKGIVNLEWKATVEDHSLQFEVERSTDGQQFEVAGKTSAIAESRAVLNFSWRDDHVEENQTYYYRLKNLDIFGNRIQSNVTRIEAREELTDFSLEVFWSTGARGNELNIRLFSTLDRQVNLKMLDQNYCEVALLFNDGIQAGSRNLLKVTEALPKGKYLLIADIGDRRISRQFFRE
ncbi:MAG: lamin tail domain-containing protein [Bacteroidia bacterium]|nr:lamin tail domain-containing protein [Bacteroidia bacterium]